MSKIIGVTVGTPLSVSTIKEKLKPVTSVNGVEADANGNVNVEAGGGAENLVVTFTIVNDSDSYFAENISHTYEQVKAAYDAGAAVVAKGYLHEEYHEEGGGWSTEGVYDYELWFNLTEYVEADTTLTEGEHIDSWSGAWLGFYNTKYYYSFLFYSDNSSELFI